MGTLGRHGAGLGRARKTNGSSAVLVAEPVALAATSRHHHAMKHTALGPASSSYFSQRLRLHAVDWGNHDAPPLLLVHGTRDHCRSWDWLAQALRDRFHILAPDLRGHGDSQWALGGSYAVPDYVYDVDQLLTQRQRFPVSIVGHSLGGAVSLLYAGLYPDRVRRLVVIEGIWPSLAEAERRRARPIGTRMGGWIDQLRDLSGRAPRRYAGIEEALARMREENPSLSPEQARHLTVHGVNQNEDGTFSWKFDNYVRALAPYTLAIEDVHALWRRITCPVMLVHGTASWAGDPSKDGRADFLRDVRVEMIEGAGHWVHHDRFEQVRDLIADFLG